MLIIDVRLCHILHGIIYQRGRLIDSSLEDFPDADYASKAIAGRYRVETFRVEMLVYVDFSGLRNEPPFRLLEQSTLEQCTLLSRRKL